MEGAELGTTLNRFKIITVNIFIWATVSCVHGNMKKAFSLYETDGQKISSKIEAIHFKVDLIWQHSTEPLTKFWYDSNTDDYYDEADIKYIRKKKRKIKKSRREAILNDSKIYVSCASFVESLSNISEHYEENKQRITRRTHIESNSDSKLLPKTTANKFNYDSNKMEEKEMLETNRTLRSANGRVVSRSEDFHLKKPIENRKDEFKSAKNAFSELTLTENLFR
jgi:hypothetical protein